MVMVLACGWGDGVSTWVGCRCWHVGGVTVLARGWGDGVGTWVR